MKKSLITTLPIVVIVLTVIWYFGTPKHPDPILAKNYRIRAELDVFNYRLQTYMDTVYRVDFAHTVIGWDTLWFEKTVHLPTIGTRMPSTIEGALEDIQSLIVIAKKEKDPIIINVKKR